MQFPTSARYAAVRGFGSYRPSRVVTNDELALRVDTTDAWISSRVGISERRYADDGESLEQMAAAAAKSALASAGLSGSDIDLVIAASCSQHSPMPGIAPSVAEMLGADAPGAYDINAACAGFCYGLAQASAAIQSGQAETVLVIGVERMTDWVDHDDRSTSIIFADGAGAAVVGRSDIQQISQVVWGSTGSRPDAIMIKDRHSLIEMDGPAVFRWATTYIRDQIAKICESAGVPLDEIDVFVPHQANTRIIDAMTRKIGFRDDVVVARDIATAGNTSSASIPLAVCALADSEQARSGDTVLAIGFGAGLTFAGQIFVMP